MTKERLTGKIKYWNGRKGFGFIQPDNDDKQVFIHIRAFTYRKHRPLVGQMVSYIVATDEQGRTRAEEVLVDDEIEQANPAGNKASSKWIVPVLSSLCAAVVIYTVWVLT